MSLRYTGNRTTPKKLAFAAGSLVITLAIAMSSPALEVETPRVTHVLAGENVDALRDVVITKSLDVVYIGTLAGSPSRREGHSFDIVVGRYDNPFLNEAWALEFGDSSDQYGHAVAVDTLDNIYITGQFNGRVNFGGGNHFSAGNFDAYVAKLDPTGTHVWSKRFGDSATQGGYDIATDLAGNVYVTGVFQGVINFGDGPLVSFGAMDAFLVKFNTNGQVQWTKRFGEAGNQVGYALAVDTSGVYLTGYFEGNIALGGGVLTASDQNDAFLAKFTHDGQHLWSQRVGDSGSQHAYSVVTDRGLNVYIAGGYTGTLTVGTDSYPSKGGDDIFLLSFTKDGAARWQRRYGGEENQRAWRVAATYNENSPLEPEHIVITGTFRNRVDFGRMGKFSKGGEDGFLAAVNIHGTTRAEKVFGSVEDDGGYALATSEVFVYAGVNFRSKITIDQHEKTSFGSDDALLAIFFMHPEDPDIIQIADVGNDQGKRVTIWFERSSKEYAQAANPVTHYEVYRRQQPAASKQPPLRTSLAWDHIATVPAAGTPDYFVDVDTERDSTRWDGVQHSVYYVRAATAELMVYYDCTADSGYSIDNLAPAAPQDLVYDDGMLYWTPPGDPDVLLYTVYGSNSNSFGSATIIDQPHGLNLDVSTAPYAYFFVTAWDVAGNEGPPASVTGSVTGVEQHLHAFSLSTYPNPFNPSTTVHYSIPTSGRVTLRVYNAHGSRVIDLVDGGRPAGPHTVAWNGRDANGQPVGSGVYFARLTHPAGARNVKILLLK